jgi:hypothetical protein
MYYVINMELVGVGVNQISKHFIACFLNVLAPLVISFYFFLELCSRSLPEIRVREVLRRGLLHRSNCKLNMLLFTQMGLSYL